MNKFNPNKVPKWCNWIAVDQDGCCWAFSREPSTGVSSFPYKWDNWFGEAERLYNGKPPKDWKQELYTWK